MVVVDSKAAANVEVLQVEALLADHADELHHQHRRIPEDVHLDAKMTASQSAQAEGSEYSKRFVLTEPHYVLSQPA